MKQKILFLFLWCVSLSCVAQDRIEYDGIDAIKEIKEGWLVVRLPGFEKKIAALDSMLSLNTLSQKTRRNLEQTLEQTMRDRDFIYKWYPLAFDKEYDFSHFAFIYTHQSNDFLNGRMAARDAKGQPVFFSGDSSFIIGTLDGIAGDPFRFTTKMHQTVSYPLPKAITLAGIMVPSLDRDLPQEILDADEHRGEVYRVYRHVRRIYRNLSAIYNKWY